MLPHHYFFNKHWVCNAENKFLMSSAALINPIHTNLHNMRRQQESKTSRQIHLRKLSHRDNQVPLLMLVGFLLQFFGLHQRSRSAPLVECTKFVDTYKLLFIKRGASGSGVRLPSVATRTRTRTTPMTIPLAHPMMARAGAEADPRAAAKSTRA